MVEAEAGRRTVGSGRTWSSARFVLTGWRGSCMRHVSPRTEFQCLAFSMPVLQYGRRACACQSRLGSGADEMAQQERALGVWYCGSGGSAWVGGLALYRHSLPRDPPHYGHPTPDRVQCRAVQSAYRAMGVVRWYGNMAVHVRTRTECAGHHLQQGSGQQPRGQCPPDSDAAAAVEGCRTGVLDGGGGGHGCV